ncbi:methionine synthase reductase-like [Amphiura filiformis]|uniref:methionine synthase reductase-like n=1 Tax=Amphiura filiformis TaxID=82378 RepID=UPI003B20B5E4
MTKGMQGRFLLLYGSQTGQAKAIAEEIYENAPHHGLQPEIHCLSMTDKKFSLEKEACMVMVVSTTGDGEPPETATKFWRRLKKKTLPGDHLAHLNYAILGLGDSNYNNFCRNPKNFEQRFEELGAKQFYPSGFADDAVGLEVVVEPWIDGLWPVLRKQLGLSNSDCTSNGVMEPTENKAITQSTGDDSDSGTDVDNPYGHRKSHQDAEKRTSPDVKTQTEVATRTISNDNRTNPTTLNNDTENDKADANQTSTDSRTSSLTQDSLRTSQSEGETVVDSTQDKGPSLTCSVPPLSESGLTLPLLPPAYLEVQYHKDLVMSPDQLALQGSASYPSAQSAVSMATIVSATKLTRDDAVKTALDLELDISDAPIDYQPGDAFSIICPNPSTEVDLLIQRLGLIEQADNVFSLQLIANTKKRRATIPDYIPKTCTVRHALTHCCDIRTPMKKAVLRMLVEHTENAREKRRLQELCSKQGINDYGAFIREGCLSILDVLIAFPSCNPPLGRLLEHLPRLLPRPYSISSSPLVDPKRLHFVFNIIEFPHSYGRAMARQGVCTGWLNHKTQPIQQQVSTDVKGQDVEMNMAALSISEKIKVLIFARTNTHFRLPEDPSTPIIMIGPGTGVAPFIGFLEHREMQLNKVAENGDDTIKFAPSWLFFGCRHKERDFLYRHKLEHFVKTGALSRLHVSFSRDATNGTIAPKYVQDNLRLHSTDVLDLLLEKKAILYVCGDAKNMARNVNETLLELIGKHTGKGAYDATLILAKLREEKRYREDIWT